MDILAVITNILLALWGVLYAYDVLDSLRVLREEEARKARKARI